MHICKVIFSHLAAFLSGMIAVAVYHHWWVNPDQVDWILSIAKPQTDIGYPGDWVLDILFPAIPLLGLCLISIIVMTIIQFLAQQQRIVS